LKKWDKREWRYYTNLFALEPQAKKVGHKPLKMDFWRAIADTQNYFRRISGKPNWEIVGEIFFSAPEKYYSHEHAQGEYNKRKRYLARFDVHMQLEKVIQFYDMFKPIIRDVLQSGTPMWASPHREKAQEIINQRGSTEVLRLMTAQHSTLKDK
jgi:hypothetical protein